MVKLTDFGIARVPADEVRNTGGMAPGTGAYMVSRASPGPPAGWARRPLQCCARSLRNDHGMTPFDAPNRNEIQIRAAQLEEAAPPVTARIQSAPPFSIFSWHGPLPKTPCTASGRPSRWVRLFALPWVCPDSPGWQAQQAFAERARAISDYALPSAAGRVVPAEGERLRTAVMRAYGRRSSGPRAGMRPFCVKPTLTVFLRACETSPVALFSVVPRS